MPGAGNPLAWDRYSYVGNNSVNRVDPTGHWTEKALFYDADVGENLYPPLPKLPGKRDVFVDGKYVRDPANITYEKIGEFYKGEKWDPSSLLPGILYSEFGSQIDDAATEAATRMYNEYCSAGSWSSECISKFWSYYEGTRTNKGIEKVNNFNSGNITVAGVQQVDIIDSYKSIANDMVNHQVTLDGGKTFITGGREWDRPFEWCNLCLDNVPSFSKYSEGGNWMYIFTPHQKWEACGDKPCNLTGAGCN